MEFEKVIKERESIRKFSDREVEEEKLNKILEAGRIAPTAKNLQPFKVLVVRSEEGLNKIDKASRCRYNAPVVLLVCGDRQKAYSKDNYSSYEMDATIVTTHMMLEATNLGVNNIWIKLFDEKVLSEEFEIPSNLIPVCLMPIGYRAEDCPKSPWHDKREELDNLVEYR